ncbi:MAG: alpha/beta fold hydrolase, partial [Candidatus Acidiferrales bacterium]
MKRILRLAILATALCVLASALFPLIPRTGPVAAQRDSGPALQEGYITTPDGVRLYYVKAGRGARTVILPARLFTFADFQWLAEDYTLIAYDMRNRGRSETVADSSLITFKADVEDLETIRRHFEIEKFSAIGYSYLGKLVIIYALQHPERIERLIQIGPVPLTFDTDYPKHFTAQREMPDELRKPLRDMRARNYHLTHPREYCEEEWKVFRGGLVGDPAHMEKLGPSQCDMPNEWPMNLVRHMRLHFQESAQKHTVPREQIAQVKAPVLTIHGMLD